MNNPMRLVATCFLLGFMASCGSKTKTEEVASAPAAAPTETAAAPEAAAPETAKPTAEAATFDISQVPVSTADLGTFPYLSALKNYEVSSSNSEDYDFERAYVYDGKNLITIEGKVSQRFFDNISGEKKASETMIHRNYESLLKDLGATKVFAGPVPREAIEKVGQDNAYKYGKWSVSTDHDTDVYVIRQKDKEVWVQVTSLGGDGNYNLTVTKRAAMPQQATIIKADELKKKLDTEGHVALYVNFDTDKTTIRPESEPTVAEVVTLLRQNPQLRLGIQGHTDNVGSAAHNQQLSESRAQSVAASLSQAGIESSRLQPAGFGQSKPLADNATEEGKAKNRRVELVKL